MQCDVHPDKESTLYLEETSHSNSFDDSCYFMCNVEELGSLLVWAKLHGSFPPCGHNGTDPYAAPTWPKTIGIAQE